MILDSGNRREFESGAVRDIQEGKGRCDLLPLVEVGSFLSAEPISRIGDFVETGKLFYLHNAVDAFVAEAFENKCQAMMELSIHYEEGCKKYGERNWQKGIPLHCFIDSGVRHYLKYKQGITDERHDRAFLWNMFGAIWTFNHKPEMIDLPFNETKAEPDYDKAEALKYTE